jgi:hypothetical protein
VNPELASMHEFDARLPTENIQLHSLNFMSGVWLSLYGTSGDLSAAWLAALAASRAALLSGHLATVAVYLGGELEALYEPARDSQGAPDAATITADLVDMYQSATAPAVADQMIAASALASLRYRGPARGRASLARLSGPSSAL